MACRRAALLLAVALAFGCRDDREPAPPRDELPPPRDRAAVVLMIGDGMGPAQIAATGMYAHGEPGTLLFERLPVRATIETASADGVTDSAAAATAMACGVKCENQRIGQDHEGGYATNVVEIARERGWRTGIVTTTSVTHATPAAFTVHQRSRFDMVNIATEQVTIAQPDVLLGGGLHYFLPAGDGSQRTDDGLIDDLEQAGYQIVYTRDQLADVAAPGRLFGAFAPHHLDFVSRRPADSPQPTLAEMTRAALHVLDRDGASLFLLVEGGRIDHGGHMNSLDDVVLETLAFDEAARTVMEWAEGRDDVTLIVTADHETGGLEILENRGRGAMPSVAWQGSEHTPTDVTLYGRGPGLAALDGKRRHHTAVFAVVRALISGEPLAAPEP